MSRLKDLRTIRLTGEAIDDYSENLEKDLEMLGIERQNRLRIRLSMEEALLRMRDRFGEDAVVETELSSLLGRSHIQISLEGDPYNPLSKTESELDDWNGPLLTSVGMNPQYNYLGSRNVLRLNLPTSGINPVLKIFAALLGGVILGFLGEMLLTESIKSAAADTVFTPLYDVWHRALNAIAGPVIFCMVTTAVLNLTKVTEQGGSGTHAVIRYFRASLICTFLTSLVAVPFFGIRIYEEEINTQRAALLLQEITKIIPGEIVTPFIESDTPQLLIMAVAVGVALNTIGTQARNLTRIIKQMNMVGLLLAEWIGRMSPYFILILIALEIWEGKGRVIFDIFRCLLLAVTLTSLISLLILFYVSRKKGVEIGTLMRKLKKPFLIALRKGSVDASFGQTESSCVSELGIERNFTTFSLPHGLIFYMPATAIGTLVFTSYAVRANDLRTTILWHAMAVILTVILTAAEPPVQGACLLTYTAVFSQLRVPSEMIVEAVFFDLIFGIFSSAVNQALLQLELILQADELGLLNRKKLCQKAG
ncbi:MAG: cation:dicarboxylase symporter family transporter [Lachnospiraceae bacterium]|nr:cation:dicarboxylase symporter family transporter [Lachnospiraceae bacterium]